MSVNPAEIKLTAAQQAYIAAEAERSGKPWRLLVAELVPAKGESRMEGGANALEAAQHLGLVGSCEGGPVDLATNPIHMEGFGHNASESNAG